MIRPLLLFVVTEDWYFLSHRLPMARAAQAAGFEVAVATRVGDGRAAIEAEGIRVFPLGWQRRGAGLKGEIKAVLELVRLYRRLRPAIIHHIALRPALFGSLAAHALSGAVVVNSVAGLGYAFIGREWRARLLRAAMLLAFRLLWRGRRRWLVVQNADDLAFFTDNRIVAADRTVIIRGSGIDTTAYAPCAEPAGPVRATLVARMLWDKGVGEFVAAARLLRAKGVQLVCTLVGMPDPANPKSVPEAQLRQWAEEGVVEWWGQRADIAQVWAQSAIAVLPSYREGLPKALLEAAACGRPLVATDVPGCRELVRDGVNGLLARAEDAASLAAALDRLAGDASLRKRLGEQARRDAETVYADGVVARAIGELYRAVLASRPGSGGAARHDHAGVQ